MKAAIKGAEKLLGKGWKMFKSKDLLGSFRLLGSGTRKAASASYRSNMRSFLSQPANKKLIAGAGAGVGGAGKRVKMARSLMRGNRGSAMSSTAKEVWHGSASGKTAQSQVGLRTGLQQYMWPSAGPQSYWKGTKYGNVSANKVGITKLRRTGGAALGAWAGVNMMRRGDNIGPF